MYLQAAQNERLNRIYEVYTETRNRGGGRFSGSWFPTRFQGPLGRGYYIFLCCWRERGQPLHRIELVLRCQVRVTHRHHSHLHTMVTGGGLHRSSDTWVSRVYYDRDPLMKSWRKAVIALLRTALRAGQLHTKMTVDQMEEMLIQQEKRWWSIKIQSFEDKGHFLQYAGRYVRRPPIASVVSPGSGNEPSGFGTKTKGCAAGFTCSAHWKSSLTAGPNTFRNPISTLFGALGCLLRAVSAKPRRPSLSFCARSEGHAPNLAPGRTP
jgi:hypothetical protein